MTKINKSIPTKLFELTTRKNIKIFLVKGGNFNLKYFGMSNFNTREILLTWDSDYITRSCIMCHELGHFIINDIGLRWLLLKFNITRSIDEKIAIYIGNIIRKLFVPEITQFQWIQFNKKLLIT